MPDFRCPFAVYIFIGRSTDDGETKKKAIRLENTVKVV